MDYTAHGILQGQNTGVGSLSLLQGIFLLCIVQGLLRRGEYFQSSFPAIGIS